MCIESFEKREEYPEGIVSKTLKEFVENEREKFENSSRKGVEIVFLLLAARLK